MPCSDWEYTLDIREPGTRINPSQRRLAASDGQSDEIIREGRSWALVQTARSLSANLRTKIRKRRSEVQLSARRYSAFWAFVSFTQAPPSFDRHVRDKPRIRLE